MPGYRDIGAGGEMLSRLSISNNYTGEVDSVDGDYFFDDTIINVTVNFFNRMFVLLKRNFFEILRRYDLKSVGFVRFFETIENE